MKRKLNIQTSYRISFFITTIKMPLLSNLLIFLYYKFIKGVFYTRTNIFIDGGYLTDIPIKVK